MVKLPGFTAKKIFSRALSAMVLAAVLLARGSSVFAAVTDPLYTELDTDTTRQWGHARVNIKDAWNVTSGSPTVVIALLDTGGSPSHPELADAYVSSAMWRNYSSASSVIDNIGYGTALANVIGARSDGAYMVGVASGVRILPIRVTNDSLSSSVASLASAIVYASTVTIAGDAKVRVILITLAGNLGSDFYEYNQGLQDAVNFAHGKNICVIALSGDGKEVDTGDGVETYFDEVAYPAAMSNAFAVGASGFDDTKISSSNYGARLNLVAPGQNIISSTGTASTRYYNGTAMASAYVAGAAALVLSLRPDLEPSDVYDILSRTAKDVGPAGSDIYHGAGRLDAGAAASLARIYVPRVVDKAFSYPNPLIISSGRRAQFYVPKSIRDGADPWIRVYNFAGDLVRKVKAREWDGKDDHGEAVSSGLYFFAVETSKGKSTGRMTVIR